MNPEVGELWTWDSFVVLGAYDAHGPFLVVKNVEVSKTLLLLGSNGKMTWYDCKEIKSLIHPLISSDSSLATS